MVSNSEYCSMCRDLEHTTQADCEKCEMKCPDMWDENREAFDFWLTVRSQMRFMVQGIGGMGGMMIRSYPTGIDYSAIWLVAKTLNVDLSPALFNKLQKLTEFEIKRWRENDSE